jgi:DGQHR domain-containing protein
MFHSGLLIVPVDDELDDADKPGWIVDGQQRAAALRDAKVERFPVFVSAFITENEAEQRSQFILVNSTRPPRFTFASRSRKPSVSATR